LLKDNHAKAGATGSPGRQAPPMLMVKKVYISKHAIVADLRDASYAALRPFKDDKQNTHTTMPKNFQPCRVRGKGFVQNGPVQVTGGVENVGVPAGISTGGSAVAPCHGNCTVRSRT
jgi:hypothetical protein